MDKEQFADMLDTSYLPSEILSILLKSDSLTKSEKEKLINDLVIGRELELDNDDDINWLSNELNDCYCCYASEFFQDLLLKKEIEAKVFNCLLSECEF